MNQHHPQLLDRRPHNVSVDIPAIEGCAEITGSDTFTVNADLSGSIAVSPDPPIVNQQATLSATQAAAAETTPTPGTPMTTATSTTARLAP